MERACAGTRNVFPSQSPRLTLAVFNVFIFFCLALPQSAFLGKDIEIITSCVVPVTERPSYRLPELPRLNLHFLSLALLLGVEQGCRSKFPRGRSVCRFLWFPVNYMPINASGTRCVDYLADKRL